MIVLDTNVISALMRAKPDGVVAAWLDEQPGDSIWTTAVTVFEVRFGLSAMAKGKKQRALQEAFDLALRQDLEGRVLDFDVAAANEAGVIAARLRSAGRSVDVRDVQIAGIVAARRGTLATRNVKHFEHSGVSLVNPWA
ncbi:MAG: type II toxin-antitoxin system VapC family toxin [Phycisphaeraceae bacterium]|nr:type II toxin-antitoxin system VapC family toxin [Phycisphaeraceae bacterium]